MVSHFNNKLTPKKKAFALEFVKDHNAHRAALTLGYSPKTAPQISYRLVHDPVVKAEIDRLKARMLEVANISDQYVLHTLRDIIEVNKVPDAGAAKHQVVLRATEMLGKHLGLWDSGNGDRHRRVHELTDKELIALGMKLAQVQMPTITEPMTIEATVESHPIPTLHQNPDGGEHDHH